MDAVQHVLSLPWYKWLTDLGGVIGGGLALIAGWLAYRAGLRQARETRDASEAQLAAAAAKERLQMQGIALGVAPELDFIEVRHKRATKLINEQWGSGMNARIPGGAPQSEGLCSTRKFRFHQSWTGALATSTS